tara:strand:+ start:1358 stop:1993 length:636 start_codon:yes stop_codon:yes gene_type:complete
MSLESYLTKLVSTKYGTFTGGRKRRRTRRRTRRRKKRRKKTKRRRKRKKRGATKKRKHPEGSQDEPSGSRRRMRIRDLGTTEAERRRRGALIRNEFERGQPLFDERTRRNFNNRHTAIMDRTRELRRREAHHLTIEDLEILIHDIVKLRNEMQEFIRKYDFDAPLYGDPNFPHNSQRGELSFVRDILLEDLNDRILSLERLMRRLEDDEED